MTWARVAAAGTDPGLLADVVAAVHADEAETRRRLAAAIDDGAGPGAALRRAAQPRLTDDPALRRIADQWHRAGVRVALPGDPAYPSRLTTIADPPPFLAARGNLAGLAERPVVAIVGSRAATSYGRSAAAWFAESAAAAGVHIVSGGAVGIDAAGHGAAVDQPGGTTVVLGCGHGVAYPRPHAAPGGLFDRVVAAGGAVLSEGLPGTPPRPPRVRARNRLVAGLADVVVVVEGGARSGSLLTATAAVERGTAVMAVPGDVRAPGSAAPHRLLLEGALPCTDPADLLDALGVAAEATDGRGSAGARADRARPSVLPPALHGTLAAAWPRPVPTDDLARGAGMATGALLAVLTRARIAGEVAQHPDGIVLRRRPEPS